MADPAGTGSLSPDNAVDGDGISNQPGQTEIRTERLRYRPYDCPPRAVGSDDRVVSSAGYLAGMVVLDNEHVGVLLHDVGKLGCAARVDCCPRGILCTWCDDECGATSLECRLCGIR